MTAAPPAHRVVLTLSNEAQKGHLAEGLAALEGAVLGSLHRQLLARGLPLQRGTALKAQILGHSCGLNVLGVCGVESGAGAEAGPFTVAVETLLELVTPTPRQQQQQQPGSREGQASHSSSTPEEAPASCAETWRREISGM
jgi:hypothetical protein